ncbi:TPA: hypothetical protein LNF46_003313 [Vibrio cholerae]|nr:hypothetical protein [Vibrio cholerae]HBK7271724.1 hypothetical protein [Vibrio cholerae]HBK7293929.1 hypothetical protein [Vibrio cholerae]HBK7297380.1 hypothetical protein [Vibrio cholerae]
MTIDMITLIGTFLLGTASSLFATWLWLRRKKKLKERLLFLEDEKNLIVKISTNGLSYVKYTLQTIMYALGVICVANMIPLVSKIMKAGMPAPGLLLMELATWGAAAAILFKNWHVGSASYKENAERHIAKIDDKISKTKRKLEE